MEAVTLLGWGFDSLLGMLLLWLGWRTLACPDLFRATILFIAFGLLMALAWVRLDAPDVALAEAAIGAGLTGALLLSALARLRASDDEEQARPALETPPHRQRLTVHSLSTVVALLLMASGFIYVMLSLAPYAPGLSAEIDAQLHSSGVRNPVTAVLLNFRGYDTLLEMIVLLLALLGVWSLGGTTLSRGDPPAMILNTLSRLLTPLLILVAAYLLWVGADAPGGAFQAGSVLGAAGVLLLLSGWRLRSSLLTLPLRLLLVTGPATFVVLALITLLIEGQLLQYPTEHAGVLILMLETAATLSIGATLAALFLGGDLQKKEHP